MPCCSQRNMGKETLVPSTSVLSCSQHLPHRYQFQTVCPSQKWLGRVFHFWWIDFGRLRQVPYLSTHQTIITNLRFSGSSEKMYVPIPLNTFTFRHNATSEVILILLCCFLYSGDMSIGWTNPRVRGWLRWVEFFTFRWVGLNWDTENGPMSVCAPGLCSKCSWVVLFLCGPAVSTVVLA